jgi:hypothetical protein
MGRGGILATSALAVADPAALAAVEPALAALATAPATGIINSTSEPSPTAVSGFLMSAFFWPPAICMTVVGNTNEAAVPATV